MNACAGRIFDYEIIRQAGGWPEELALAALEDLTAHGFVRERQAEGAVSLTTLEPALNEALSHSDQRVEGTFIFAHHLVQETLYADLTAPRRAYLHRRLAEAIQSLCPNDIEALAYHFTQAGDKEHARIYHLQAGARAQKLVALKDAAEHYQAALERWPAADPLGQAETLYKLGQCQWVIMETQQALESFESARALFEALGQRIKTGDIERMIGRMQ